MLLRVKPTKEKSSGAWHALALLYSSSIGRPALNTLLIVVLCTYNILLYAVRSVVAKGEDFFQIRFSCRSIRRNCAIETSQVASIGALFCYAFCAGMRRYQKAIGRGLFIVYFSCLIKRISTNYSIAEGLFHVCPSRCRNVVHNPTFLLLKVVCACLPQPSHESMGSTIDWHRNNKDFDWPSSSVR